MSPYFSQNKQQVNDLKKDAINKFGIKYWIWNQISGTWERAPDAWILKKKYDYWWKNTDFKDWQGD